MSQKKVDDKQLNIFSLNSLYPDADAVFSFKPQALEQIKDNCIIVLDTNVLLIPFDTGKESLQQIKATYESLTKVQRLVIPGQVAREFAKNRSEKLKTIYQQISRKRNLSITRQVYPLLESSEEYQKLTEMEKEIDSKISDYRKQIASLLSKISGWYWDDPVSSLYRELFSSNVVFDIEHDEEKLQLDLNYRQLHSIPPGFQDSAKEDKGIGDLLIWHTILELGKTRNQDIIFVTNDSKNDWWYQSENQALYPRFELIEEYRRCSAGKTIHLINFSDFLQLFGASPEVVNEVRQEEVLSNIQIIEFFNEVDRPLIFALKATAAVREWILVNYSDIIINKDVLKQYPDFIAYNSEFGKLGFEVKAYTKNIGISDSIRSAIYQAQQAVSEGDFDKLIVVFVVPEENIEQLDATFVRLRIDTAKIPVILGTLSPNGKFVQKFQNDSV